ncbi:MAG: hypothetical protein ACR2PL_10780 [Dehalococcoidia bacterium]
MSDVLLPLSPRIDPAGEFISRVEKAEIPSPSGSKVRIRVNKIQLLQRPKTEFASRINPEGKRAGEIGGPVPEPHRRVLKAPYPTVPPFRTL